MAGTANVSKIRASKDVKTGLSANDRKTICESLSEILEDSYSLLLKTQIVHWNVRGAREGHLDAARPHKHA